MLMPLRLTLHSRLAWWLNSAKHQPFSSPKPGSSTPGVDCMLVGADSVQQFDSALAAPDTRLSKDERYELEHNHTPCDVINDGTAGKRITRESRAARGFFTVDNLKTRNIA
jgi:hypothetical protein